MQHKMTKADALRHALDDILAMSEEELLADFGTPESKYFFAELALAEKFFCGTADSALFDDAKIPSVTRS